MGIEESENPAELSDDKHENTDRTAVDDETVADRTPTEEHSEQWLANARQAGEKIKAIFKS
jgi:hypothetical protein